MNAAHARVVTDPLDRKLIEMIRGPATLSDGPTADDEVPELSDEEISAYLRAQGVDLTEVDWNHFRTLLEIRDKA